MNLRKLLFHTIREFHCTRTVSNDRFDTQTPTSTLWIRGVRIPDPQIPKCWKPSDVAVCLPSVLRPSPPPRLTQPCNSRFTHHHTVPHTPPPTHAHNSSPHAASVKQVMPGCRTGVCFAQNHQASKLLLVAKLSSISWRAPQVLKILSNVKIACHCVNERM